MNLTVKLSSEKISSCFGKSLQFKSPLGILILIGIFQKKNWFKHPAGLRGGESSDERIIVRRCVLKNFPISKNFLRMKLFRAENLPLKNDSQLKNLFVIVLL